MFLYEHDEVDNAIYHRTSGWRSRGRHNRLYRQMFRVYLRRSFQPLVGGSFWSGSGLDNCGSRDVPFLNCLLK